MLKKFSLLIVFVFVFISFAGDKTAPNYELKSLDGGKVSLEDALKNGPVLVNFWASWCTPCKEEMPELNELYEKYKDKGLSMHAISIDKGSGIAKAKNFVKSSGFKFDVLFDKGGKVLKEFGGNPGRVPYTYIVTKDGKYGAPFKGKKTKKIFEEAIKEVLAK